MLKYGDSVVAGVSGGADSMCLIDILDSLKEKYGLKLYVVHVNHGIRGETAERDEEHVKAYCSKKNICFTAVHADIPKIVKSTGQSEEEAGRNVRYSAFTDVCRQKGCKKIAVAHNSGDNAETVLFNMFRGSGISGIRGITPVRVLNANGINGWEEADPEKDIKLIRPLLNTTRKEIEEYLAEKNIEYVTDETNTEEEYSRNKIRNTLIPYITENINRGAVKHISELSRQAAELEELAGELTAELESRLISESRLKLTEKEGKLCEVRLDIFGVQRNNRLLVKCLIRSLVGRLAGRLKDVENSHIEDVLELMNKGTGKTIMLPYGITARNDYLELVLSRGEESAKDFCYECVIPGEVKTQNGSILTLKLIKNANIGDMPKNIYTKWFDYDTLTGSIQFRNRRTGDFLMIGAGKESKEPLRKKSLKNYFIDTKTDRLERAAVPLLALGSHVLWVIGQRRDDSYLVTEKTTVVLEVTYQPAAGDNN